MELNHVDDRLKSYDLMYQNRKYYDEYIMFIHPG